jgi:glycosyltransferase involved in cell wall biosynthesis
MNGTTIQKIPFNGTAAAPLIEKKAGTKSVCGARVSVLTAGRDKPYALGLGSALIAAGEHFDFICSDELENTEWRGNPQVNFLNLRGDQSEDAGALKKIRRVLVYYFRLFRYAATARPKVFHILWNNKFEFFDRTALMLFYKLCGKKIALTAHNVNIGERDGNDSFPNRLSLKIQYRLCDHIFVHTAKMKGDLVSGFGVLENKISVIPLGINNSVPNTALTGSEARRRLGLGATEKVILFFGRIAPYKGLEYLIAAFATIATRQSPYRLIIAGTPKYSDDCWTELQELIAGSGAGDKIIQKIEFVPDAETEIYFKAADVLVLPYTRIFQSGLLSLGYSFGLPVIAADVSSLKEEIVEGKTGFVFEPKNANALAHALENYFESDLHRELDSRRAEIQNFANERYSWGKIAMITTNVYSNLSREGKNCRHQPAPKKA